MATDVRASMDQCLETIKTTGRSSLQSDNPLAGLPLEMTSEKPAALRKLLGLLEIEADRVAHENHRKYILLRDGVTSYVYLAAR